MSGSSPELLVFSTNHLKGIASLMNSLTVSDQPINQHANSLSAPHRRRQRPARPTRSCSFSAQELIQLLAAAGNDATAIELKQIAAIVFYTGIRPGELKSLTWSDVDIEKRSMRVGSKSGKQRTVRSDTRYSRPWSTALRPTLARSMSWASPRWPHSIASRGACMRCRALQMDAS
jgi:integrase